MRMRFLDGLIARPERAFLLLALVFGPLFMVLTPPFQTNDEWNHFFRAYQISEGRMLSERDAQGVAGGSLPLSLLVASLHLFSDVPYAPENEARMKEILALGRLDDETMDPFGPGSDPSRRGETIRSLLRMPLEPDRRTFIYFFRTAVYNPAAYAPPALGIALGRAAGLAPVGLLYAGRLFSLLAWASLMYLAIKAAPVGKWLFFLLALLPSTLFLAPAVSLDPLANGLGFYLIALMLKLAYGRPAYDGWNPGPSAFDIIWVVFVSVLLALAKHYFLVPCLLLILPPGAMPLGRRIALAAMAAAFAAIASLSWMAYARSYFALLEPGISPQEQLLFVLGDPGGFASAVARSLYRYGPLYVREFAGRMGHYPLFLPGPAIALEWAALAAAAFFGTSGARIPFSHRALMAAVAAGSLLTVTASIYLVSSPVGHEVVEGLQGRYLMPVAPLPFLAMAGLGPKIGQRGLGVGAASFAALSLAFSSYVLARGYFQ